MTGGRWIDWMFLALLVANAAFVVLDLYQIATTGRWFWVIVLAGNSIVVGTLAAHLRIRRHRRRVLAAHRRAIVIQLGQNGHRRR